MNLRRGFRRILVVLAGVYWLVVICGSVSSYFDAYKSVMTTQANAAEAARQRKAEGDAATAALEAEPAQPSQPSQAEIKAAFDAQVAHPPPAVVKNPWKSESAEPKATIKDPWASSPAVPDGATAGGRTEQASRTATDPYAGIGEPVDGTGASGAAQSSGVTKPHRTHPPEAKPVKDSWKEAPAEDPADGVVSPSAMTATELQDLAARYRAGSLTSRQRAIYEDGVRQASFMDPYALKRIARADGWKAASAVLVIFVPLFVALVIVGAVLGWVARGFAGPPRATP